jgi:hypothetical protein
MLRSDIVMVRINCPPQAFAQYPSLYMQME